MSDFHGDLETALHLVNTVEGGGCNCDPDVGHECEACFIHGVLCQCKERLAAAEVALHEAGDGDTWKAAAKRLEGELEASRESRNAWKLNAEASSKSCNRLRDERDAALTDNERLRGLLREVADEWDRINGWIMQHPTRAATPITLLRTWRHRVTTALEGKQ